MTRAAVTEYLRQHPAPARARLTLCAETLGVSSTTLRRRLAAEGTSWQRMLDAEIHERASRMRKAGVMGRIIARQLGYLSECSYWRARRRSSA